MKKYLVNIIGALLLTYSSLAQNEINKDKLNIIKKNEIEYAVFGKDTIPFQNIISHKSDEKLIQTNNGFIYMKNHHVKYKLNNDTISVSYGEHREIKKIFLDTIIQN